nr:MAG: hypothetical protein DiTV3a_F3ORF11 [Diabrotica toursvirus 3a]
MGLGCKLCCYLFCLWIGMLVRRLSVGVGSCLKILKARGRGRALDISRLVTIFCFGYLLVSTYNSERAIKHG